MDSCNWSQESGPSLGQKRFTEFLKAQGGTGWNLSPLKVLAIHYPLSQHWSFHSKDMQRAARPRLKTRGAQPLLNRVDLLFGRIDVQQLAVVVHKFATQTLSRIFRRFQHRGENGSRRYAARNGKSEYQVRRAYPIRGNLLGKKITGCCRCPHPEERIIASVRTIDPMK